MKKATDLRLVPGIGAKKEHLRFYGKYSFYIYKLFHISILFIKSQLLFVLTKDSHSMHDKESEIRLDSSHPEFYPTTHLH